MTNQVCVKWACPKCDTVHSLTEPRLVAVDIANDLLAAGILCVALYDETYATMCDQDKAEAACLPTDANQLTPVASSKRGLTNWLTSLVQSAKR